MVVAVHAKKRLDAHSETAGRLPRIDAVLHQPRRDEAGAAT
jgi:hypothetical protein